MDSPFESGAFTRTSIEPRPAGLATIAVAGGVACVLSLWLAAAAILVADGSIWLILPLSMFGAAFFGGVCWWAVRRRLNRESAIIIDEVGIYDNVSPMLAGRVRWCEMERAWVAGLTWMQFLCIQPGERQQGDIHHNAHQTMMRLSAAFTGASIIIPMWILDMPQEDVWYRFVKSAGAAHAHLPSSDMATGF